MTACVTTKGVTISPSCAQPSEKEISDFVFEHGKGNAIYDIIVIYKPTNNVDYIKYITPKPHAIYKHIFALYVSQNVTAGYIPPPIFVSMKYVLQSTTLSIYNIEHYSNSLIYQSSTAIFDFVVITTYNQRCVYEISPQNPPTNLPPSHLRGIFDEKRLDEIF